MDDNRREALFERAIELNMLTLNGENLERVPELHALEQELGEALEDEPDAPDETFARACHTYSRILRETGHIDRIPRYIEATRRLAERERTRVMAALDLGRFFLEYRRFERGLEHVLSLDVSSWAPELVGRRCMILGGLYNELGLREDGRRVCREGLALAREHAFSAQEAIFLHELGVSYLFDDDYEQAYPFFEESFHITSSRYRSVPFSFSALNSLVYCLIGLRRLDEAELRLRRLDELASASPEATHRFYAHATRLMVSMARGQWEATLDAHERAVRELGEVADVHPRAMLELPRVLALVFGRGRDPGELELLAHESGLDNLGDYAFVSELAGWVLSAPECDAPGFTRNLFVSEAAYDAVRAARAGEPLEGGEWTGIEDALVRAAKGASDAESLLVRGDVEELSIDGDSWISMRRKQTGRVFVRTLVDAWPLSVDAWVLHDAIWPDARVSDPSALNRLYAVVHRLRGSGLDDVIVSTADGYRLGVRPVRVDAES